MKDSKINSTSKFEPITFIPDERSSLTKEQIKNIAEYGGININDEGVHNINRAIEEYLISRMQQSKNDTSYADIRKHSKKVIEQSEKLIDLLQVSDDTSYYFEAFIDGVNDHWLRDFKINNLLSDLKKLKSSCEFWTDQKAKRSPNFAFISFIHHLKDIYLRMGGDSGEFPVGASKLRENEADGKQYDSLFVDFVERVIKEVNVTLSQDKDRVEKRYGTEDYAKIKGWYKQINLQNTQTLAKAIQRALTDKPL